MDGLAFAENSWAELEDSLAAEEPNQLVCLAKSVSFFDEACSFVINRS